MHCNDCNVLSCISTNCNETIIITYDNVWYCIFVHCHVFDFVEGSLEVKLPTIWTDEKQRWEESERREE
jgi:hypothetical protein